MENDSYEEFKELINYRLDERNRNLQDDLLEIDTSYRDGELTRDGVFQLLGFVEGLAQAGLNYLVAAKKQFELEAPKQSTKGKAR